MPVAGDRYHIQWSGSRLSLPRVLLRSGAIVPTAVTCCRRLWSRLYSTACFCRKVCSTGCCVRHGCSKSASDSTSPREHRTRFYHLCRAVGSTCRHTCSPKSLRTKTEEARMFMYHDLAWPGKADRPSQACPARPRPAGLAWGNGRQGSAAGRKTLRTMQHLDVGKW